jgi:2-hydroxychromene-2-carboxylate isomerase
LLESFLQGVFTDGLDAGSDRGLLHIAHRAGLTPTDVQHALSDKRWRIEAERNRSDMLARGIWGVPSFRVNEQAVLWGQDRLWMLEEDLISELNS